MCTITLTFVCRSVNEVICHGIPDSRPLENGDIVNIDISVYHDGFHADLNETYFVGTVDEKSRHLVQATYECMMKGIEIGMSSSSIHQSITIISHPKANAPFISAHHLINSSSYPLPCHITSHQPSISHPVISYQSSAISHQPSPSHTSLTHHHSLICVLRATVKPGVLYREVGNCIQKHAQANGLSVVRTYCGHGIGTYFHAPPNIPHYASIFSTH